MPDQMQRNKFGDLIKPTNESSRSASDKKMNDDRKAGAQQNVKDESRTKT